MTRAVPPAIILAGAAVSQTMLSRHRTVTAGSGGAAALLAIPSLALLAASIRGFQRAGTTIDPRSHARASSLVTTGANALSRNPMYLAMAGLLIAHATARRSPIALVPAALFIVWIDHAQIAKEETHLRQRFGPEFDAYTRRVRRWV